MALGLHCCSCFSLTGARGRLSSRGAQASHWGGFSCCRANSGVLDFQQFQLPGFRAQTQQLWQTGSYASCHVGSSQTRDQTYVSCIGSQIFYDWTTGKPSFTILISPRVTYLNFPVSQNIKMEKKPLFSTVGIIHVVPLGMLRPKLSRTSLTLTDVLTCPPSEKAWLRHGKPIISPNALPLFSGYAQKLLCFLHNTWVKISYRNECIVFSLMATSSKHEAVLSSMIFC